MTGPLNSAAPTTSILVGGVYNTVAPNPLPTQESALQVDASGNLLVNVIAGNPVPASTIKSIKAVAVTAGTPQAVWTPASGKRFILLGFSVGTSGTSASVLFEDGTGNEFARTPVVTVGANSAPAFLYTSSAQNNALFIDVTASATVSGYVFGYEQ